MKTDVTNNTHSNGIIRNLVPITGITITVLAACAAHYVARLFLRQLSGFELKGGGPIDILMDESIWLLGTTLFVCALFGWAIFLHPERAGKPTLSSIGLVALVAYVLFWAFNLGHIWNLITVGEALEGYEQSLKLMRSRKTVPQNENSQGNEIVLPREAPKSQ
jgi:hypothetical protein